MSISSQQVAQLEALLYVSGEALEKKKIEELLDVSAEELASVIAVLHERYQDSHSGLMLIEHGSVLEIATKPDHATVIEKFTKSFLQENLSKAALEVLAIIAYRGPITRAAIESIRGVNCSFTLRNLLIRGLITREENPEDNREYVYTASLSLLEKLGIASQNELPDFSTLSQDVRLQESKSVEDTASQNTTQTVS